jgi:NAD(P) transhydrogenase subunit beta
MTVATIFLLSGSFRSALYILGFGMFIYGLSGLTGPRTAVRGNRLAAAGMAVVIAGTLLRPHVDNWALIVSGLAVGTAIGIPAARLVRMTQMPQMVAIFNGVGGGAVALIAWVEFRSSHGYDHTATYVAIFSVCAAIVGSVSFWGSGIAFGKLQELIPGRPLAVGRLESPLKAALAAAAIACGVVIVAGAHHELWMVALLLLSGTLGAALVLPIGGADMPVVIALLNAFTGLSAAATGIALNNTAMIVAGMIVGASGSILTNLMAKAMNRSIQAIVAGGFGGGETTSAAAAGAAATGAVRSTTPADVAIGLTYARQVVIVPGYGLAVSQAQYALRDMTKLLEAAGVLVKYAIHPVAGRMPGHMNVLLAEAEVPYEQLVEMDDINPELPRTDVVLVIGANDVVNPDAHNNPHSPLYGMPIIEAEQAQSIVVLKRSMRPGYAGVDNPLFLDPKTSMLFGDAKASILAVTQELGTLVPPATAHS